MFSRRIIDYVKDMLDPGQYTLSEEFQMDVNWWLNSMTRFNGKSNIINMLDLVAVAVINKSDLFVFGLGEETKPCQWDYDGIVEPVWHKEGSLMTLILPLQCVNNRSIKEVVMIIYCSMYFIFQRDVNYVLVLIAMPWLLC